MEFAGGGPGMEGKDPDEVIEQLKNGVKKALENTDQTKRELIQGIIEFVDHGDAEMAGLRVAAIEADPASYLQSKKKTEKRFAECVRSLQLLRSKLNDACKEREALAKHASVTVAQVAIQGGVSPHSRCRHDRGRHFPYNDFLRGNGTEN